MGISERDLYKLALDITIKIANETDTTEEANRLLEIIKKMIEVRTNLVLSP